MFQLSKEEFENWRSQIVTSNSAAKMGQRRRPYAFTEHGIAMLSLYDELRRTGKLTLAPTVKIVRESPVTALV